MKATLLICLALASPLLGCRGGESELPPVHLIPNMDTQEKGRAYRRDTSGLFADGRVMRAPVEGTVAVGHLDEDDVLHEGKDLAGRVSKKFPASIAFNDDAVKGHGKLRFNIFCAPCHGVAGDGKGPVALKGGMLVAPPSLLEERMKTMCVGQVYAAIKHGVNNGNMPSYAAQVPVEDRWAIVAYLRQLQGVNPPEACERATVPVATVASAEHGALVYKGKGCNACHSLDGSKMVGPTWKGSFGTKRALASGAEVTVDEAYLKESILTPAAKLAKDFPPVMPAIPLSDIDVDSVILFIKAQQ